MSNIYVDLVINGIIFGEVIVIVDLVVGDCVVMVLCSGLVMLVMCIMWFYSFDEIQGVYQV